MFLKRKKSESMAKATAVDTHTFDKVVSGTKIIGEIVSESPIKIDGTIQGNINCKDRVVVGKTGVIVGDVKCKDADISGKIEGKIFVSNLLQLRNSANVKGEIKINKLEVEPGAMFNGTCNMTNGSSNAPMLGSPSTKNEK